MTPRFVILEHHWDGVHYDFMLEAGDVLWTWKLPEPPSPGCRWPATRIGDHRKLYLDYEGPLSRNRGHVLRWDAGTYELMCVAEGEVRVELRGARVAGGAILHRIDGDRWEFALEPPLAA